MAPDAAKGADRAPAVAVPWARDAEDVCKQLGVDPRVGLSAAEVEARQAKFGFNELEKEPGA